MGGLCPVFSQVLAALLQYAADPQDKQWLAEQQHMRATGGKMVSTPGLVPAAAQELCGNPLRTDGRRSREAGSVPRAGPCGRTGRGRAGAPRPRDVCCSRGSGRRKSQECRDGAVELPCGHRRPQQKHSACLALLQAYLLLEEDIRDLAATDDYR